MHEVVEFLPGLPDSRLLLVADHASNRVPADIDLGIPPHFLNDHIAVDIGVDPLARAVSQRLGCPAILASVSRLVVDLNRDADEAGAIPEESDGCAIPGNRGLSAADRGDRLARFWHPYHLLVAAKLDQLRPKLLFTLHSFTPQLATRPHEKRPWEVGILHNRDDRAASLAIAALRRRGFVTGDNEPYSGRELNASMNRHAEARNLPYINFEVRQDLISDRGGIERWAVPIAEVVEEVAAALPDDRQ
jgi:predicted N-formylglutamate amidohydrolase